MNGIRVRSQSDFHDPTKHGQDRKTLRRVLLELTVAVPFFLMAVVGVDSRTRPSTFSFEFYDQPENDQIAAYAPIVSAVESGIPEARTPNAPVVRSLAHRWVNDFHSGKLRIPEPAYGDDSVDHGVKSEIFAANVQVVIALNILSDRDANNQNWTKSAQDALLSLQTASTTQSFDVISLIRDNQIMSRSLSLLRRSLPHASAAVRSEAAQVLSRIPMDRETLAKIALRARTLYVQQRVGRDVSLESALDATRDLTLDHLFDPDVRREQSRLRSLSENPTDPGRSILVGDLAIAYRGVMQNRDQIDRLIRQLQASHSLV